MVVVLPSRTSDSVNMAYNKRQQPSESVVHVTITAAGTVVYTYTATSYSYIPSYSTISTSNPSMTNSNNNGNNGSSGSHNNSNIGAIAGGVVGGVVFVALIALLFLFLRRQSQKRKREKQKNELIDDDDDSYYRGLNGRPLSAASVDHTNPAVMTSLNSPRPLVAPEGLRESKYFQGDGYYEDRLAPYPKAAAYYSANNSVASDSLPSTAVDINGGYRNVPNEIEHFPEERHVPHLKESSREEPPHARD
ncbi:hypothetical protein A0J61_05041 [Choanephora cucurbitarum]|uniref:receptor protein-tyrosine kinase n=1 Tax=Choanephora cucurbitarum TaxID=101091 RepID=A0A1C7NHT5_9FUNG|nr:hypothetical protein A0J61_05041 [Choanephora cucurbitarum]